MAASQTRLQATQAELEGVKRQLEEAEDDLQIKDAALAAAQREVNTISPINFSSLSLLPLSVSRRLSLSDYSQ